MSSPGMRQRACDSLNGATALQKAPGTITVAYDFQMFKPELCQSARDSRVRSTALQKAPDGGSVFEPEETIEAIQVFISRLPQIARDS